MIKKNLFDFWRGSNQISNKETNEDHYEKDESDNYDLLFFLDDEVDDVTDAVTSSQDSNSDDQTNLIFNFIFFIFTW